MLPSGAATITFTPFARWDEHDEERSHADIRELNWLHVSDQWEARIGIGKDFIHVDMDPNKEPNVTWVY